MANDNLVQRLLNKLQNHRGIALLVVLGVIVIWIGDVTGAISKIVAAFSARTDSIQQPAGPPAGDVVDSSLIAAEVAEVYRRTGELQSFFDDWGRPPARQTLRVVDKQLVGSVPGRQVAMPIDPDLLPNPGYYDSNIAKIGTIRGATAVSRCFSSYAAFRQSLSNLTLKPSDCLGVFTTTSVIAGETTTRCHAALCAMGETPPPMFLPGGPTEFMPQECPPGS